MELWPLILAGGSGERLWPVSRRSYPKQYQALHSDRSLLQECALRMRGLDGARPPTVICGAAHRFITAEQLRQAGVAPAAILLEPERRNTAPAIAAGACWIARARPEAIVAAVPSDHMLADGAALQQAMADAAELAAQGRIVAIGVEPRSPSTSFGYIQQGEPLNAASTACRVERFTEKPDLPTAEKFLRDGGYWWNAGIFVFAAHTLLEQLEQHAPNVATGARAAVADAAEDLEFLRLAPDAFAGCPSISIDYALMEKTAEGAAVRLDSAWSDIGSWAGVWEAGDKDAHGNVTVGDVLLDGVRDSYVRSDVGLLAVQNVERLAVVATADATLVSGKGSAEAMRAIVRRLTEAGRDEADVHARQYRPWGSFETLGSGPGFLVKRLQINPGASISLQKHRHRAEHWVVVQGEAQITRDDETFTLHSNESVYIPKGAVHRIENRTDAPALIVEVQTGEELREDDIIRIEDQYRRT